MVLSVSIVERLRIAKPALPSRKTTGLYSGCMPFFIRSSISNKRRHIVYYVCKGGTARAAAPPGWLWLTPDALQLAQELGVGAGLLELGYEELQLRRGLEGVEDAAHLPNPLGLGRLHEELFLARRGVLDVDGRVEPAVRQLAVEPQLHVARALELLEDDLVHPAAGLDQRGREDRERAAVLDVARRPEELLGRVKRRRVHSTRQYPAARRSREVVGPREPGYAVEQHDHVLALLDEALDALEDQLCHRYVVIGGLVEGRGDYLGLLHAPLPVGDLLRALVCEHHEELGLGVVGGDGLGYLLKHGGLACLGRRDDHAALALAYGGHQVYDARRDVVRLPLQPQPLHRIERRQVVEVGAPAALLGLLAVDGLDAHHRRVLLPVASRPYLADYVVPATQVEAFDLARRDVHVALALAVAAGPDEPEPIGQHVQDARLDQLLAAVLPLSRLLPRLLALLLGSLRGLDRAVGATVEGRVVRG